MKFHKIKKLLAPQKIFSINDIFLVDPDFRQPTLYDWEKKGWVKKIRNKWYVFADFQPEDKDYYLISNKIYFPSYVSLELALNHYGIIPESVQEITAVTTRKTKTFQTHLENFVYRTIKPDLFSGYRIINHDKQGIKIAHLEKAILDYFYLHSPIKEVKDIQVLRWNREVLVEDLDKKRLEKFLAIFDSPVLKKRVGLLYNYLGWKNAFN